jgi:ankyrin repeat protein
LSHGADVNAQDLDNWTALLCAAKAGNLEIVELLVENGADIEHREMGNWTSICWAAYKGFGKKVSINFKLSHLTNQKFFSQHRRISSRSQRRHSR